MRASPHAGLASSMRALQTALNLPKTCRAYLHEKEKTVLSHLTHTVLDNEFSWPLSKIGIVPKLVLNVFIV